MSSLSCVCCSSFSFDLAGYCLSCGEPDLRPAPVFEVWSVSASEPDLFVGSFAYRAAALSYIDKHNALNDHVEYRMVVRG